MKQILSAIFAAVLTLVTAVVLGGCSETVHDTGNKIVNNAESYVQSFVVVLARRQPACARAMAEKNERT